MTNYAVINKPIPDAIPNMFVDIDMFPFVGVSRQTMAKEKLLVKGYPAAVTFSEVDYVVVLADTCSNGCLVFKVGTVIVYA